MFSWQRIYSVNDRKNFIVKNVRLIDYNSVSYSTGDSAFSVTYSY
ncbi:MAG: family 49 glycosyl hydrolase [Christensenellaceae bacterium]|nr:family 49 glycosyl hydrolase [Christensenellaceae bacterium]